MLAERPGGRAGRRGVGIVTSPPQPRLRAPLPGELDPGQRSVYEEVVGGPRAAAAGLFPMTDADGRLTGPFGPMLLSPPVGGALQALGAQLRYRSVLPDRLRELAVLAVAAHEDSAFERYAHEAIGRHVGLAEQELAAVARGEDPGLDDEDERIGLATVQALLARGDLDDDEYVRARAQLGERALFELLALVAYYAGLAVQLRVFRIDLP